MLHKLLERDASRAAAFRAHIVDQQPRQVTGMAKQEFPLAMVESAPDLTGEDKAWLWPPAGGGEYHTELYVGTPRQLQVAVVDLASDLVWLGKQQPSIVHVHGHFFDPSSSSSFAPVASTSNACAAVAGEHEQNRACGVRDIADPSRVLQIAYDDMGLGLNRTAEHTSSSAISIRKIVLAVSSVEFPTGAVLGLGRGNNSFATQVLLQEKKCTFAYCLADTDEPSGSSLAFGEISDAHLDLAFTPLVTHPHAATFYMVNLVGIAVNGVRVPIARRVLELSADGMQGGTVVDMSTRFTRLPRGAFQQVVNAVQIHMRVPTTDVPGFHLCYSAEQLRRAPAVALLFAGGTRMALPMENVFVAVTEQGDILCLAIMPGRPGAATVIGITQQQNFLMVLDPHRARLGFAPRQCAAFPKFA